METSDTTPLQTPRNVIDVFGGRQPISEITGASRQSVSNWYRSGIPAKFHNRLVKEAVLRGIEGITHDGLEAINEIALSPKTEKKHTPKSKAHNKKSVGKRTVYLSVNQKSPSVEDRPSRKRKAA